MLSWSSQETGGQADLRAVVSGAGTGGAGAPGPEHGDLLLAFVDAAAAGSDSVLVSPRARLVDAAGEPFMLDAAAVIAAFEVFTRVVDGTGGRFAPETAAARSELDAALGIGALTSAR